METSTGPCKDVLYNPDLLGIICRFLREPAATFISRHRLGGHGKNLCALALTCHATSDPALDCIWEDIIGLEPLLSVFPRAISHSSNLPWVNRDPAWHQIILKAHRSPPVPYQTKHGPDSADTRTESALLLLVQLIAHYRNSFSKLKKLIVEDFAADPSMLLLFLSSPLLDEVGIVIPSDPRKADIASMSIWTVGWKVPGLRSLTLFTDYNHGARAWVLREPAHIFDSLPHLLQLRTLIIKTHSVDLSFLVSLSSLPHLAVLQVSVAQHEQPQKSLPQLAFPSLKSLHVEAYVSLMPTILKLIPQGSLTSLTYRSDADKENFNPADSVQFHAEIASRFPSLTSLAIMHPLYDLSKLREMTYLGVPCVDDDAVELATSWPEIRSLRIRSLCGTSPTYGILAVLAKHCPLLTDLEMPITFPKKDVPLRDDAVFSHRLHTLSIDSAMVDFQPAGVAHYLDRIFPFLVVIEVRKGPQWDRVRYIVLKECQPARWNQLQRLRR
ncbi:hypothetical protein EDD18DRAFT_1123592 [Armillaria luteobubalina]|uniref:F-box domain-containing protein n=1 Tax=Armillaria luteobubalina TaxID=153913 RepID=A0AA39UWL1_9AGAR|nr:hypothetical protein EDD18DRAFT_1123592 [Armillaria luteobubalina]